MMDDQRLEKLLDEALDRTPVKLSPLLDERVMAAVREQAEWRHSTRRAPLRFRVRPWAVVGAALAAAAALVLLLTRAPAAVPSTQIATRGDSENVVYVRFVLYAPAAKRVTVAGTFNQWDLNAAPLVPAGTAGVWTTTLKLPVGQHQYAFVVDGRRWVVDPTAPAVNDGFGRRNSVVAVTAHGARTL